MSVSKIYGLFFFFFDEQTVEGFSYLDMFKNWLFPQLNQDASDFMQDSAPFSFR